MRMIYFLALLFGANVCFSSGTMRSNWDFLSFISNGNKVKAVFDENHNQDLLIEISFHPDIYKSEDCAAFKFLIRKDKNDADLSTMDLFMSSNIMTGESNENAQTIKRLFNINLIYKGFKENDEFKNVIDFVFDRQDLQVKHFTYSLPDELKLSEESLTYNCVPHKPVGLELE